MDRSRVAHTPPRLRLLKKPAAQPAQWRVEAFKDLKYRTAKAQFPRHVLFFMSECGQHCRAIHDDAESFTIATGITFRIEDGIRTIRIQACVVDVYVAKLLRRGYSVAIIDPWHSSQQRVAEATNPRDSLHAFESERDQ